jgi:hypothetical protein
MGFEIAMMTILGVALFLGLVPFAVGVGLP